MSRCPNHWRGHHKFQPRYDTALPEGLSEIKGGALHIEAMKTRTYVRDICTRCGETVERAK